MEMRKVVLDENIIPPMMHPWGKAWKQPDRNNLVLDVPSSWTELPNYIECLTLTYCRIIQTPSLRVSITVKCGRLSMFLVIIANGICVGVMMKIRYHRRYTSRIERF